MSNFSKTKADIFADKEPFIAKTIKIIMSWKLEAIPQRFFNLFIFICNDYKCSEDYLKGTRPKSF